MNDDLTATSSTLNRFRRWFWRPPRAHGEIIEDRTVSFLELFYDLVYVVVVAQAAHHLAEHVSLQGFLQFAVIFGLIWIAWLNGTLYYDLHGHEDGRTRSFVFIQMALLALLAVYTGDAAGDSGARFALVYAVFLGVMALLWYSVRRVDSEEYSRMTGRYLVGMLVSIAVMAVSAFLDDDARMFVWAAVVIGWVVGSLVMGSLPDPGMRTTFRATDSMVERFGLFTILVLGEVVVGVVDGLAHVEQDPLTMVTALLALIVGFGLWWIYFDFSGRRLPRADSPTATRWMMSHLPVTLAIAAAGAAMVSIIEHAHDVRTPGELSWLLGGAVALCLAGLVVISRSLVDYDRLIRAFRPAIVAMVVGAGIALIAAWLRPPPWLLTAVLVADLSLIWLVAVARWLHTEEAEDVMARSR